MDRIYNGGEKKAYPQDQCGGCVTTSVLERGVIGRKWASSVVQPFPRKGVRAAEKNKSLRKGKEDRNERGGKRFPRRRECLGTKPSMENCHPPRTLPGGTEKGKRGCSASEQSIRKGGPGIGSRGKTGKPWVAARRSNCPGSPGALPPKDFRGKKSSRGEHTTTIDGGTPNGEPGRVRHRIH